MFDGARALLFDFDGTLVRPSIDFRQMHDQVLQLALRNGVDTLPLAEMHTLELMARVRASLGEGSAQEHTFSDQAARLILDIELEAARRTEPFAGVPAMLEHLGALGFGIGIVTRNCRAAVEDILGRHPLHHDVLVTRDDTAHVKPDPRHLLHALRVLRVSGVRAVMCGDHPMDITVGRSIGAGTVGVLQPGLDSAYFSEVRPDLVLPVATDLPNYLDPGGPGSGEKDDEHALLTHDSALAMILV